MVEAEGVQVKKNQVVEITWMDSKGVTSTWEFIEDLEQLKPCRIVSVGYLLEDREGYKTLVQSMSKGQVLGRLTIPTGCIKKVRKVEQLA